MKFAIATVLVVVLIATSVKSQKKKSSCPTIKTKRQWGGSVATSVDYQTIPVQYVIIHHTVTKKCDSLDKCAVILKNMQSYHMSIDFNDIGYKDGYIVHNW